MKMKESVFMGGLAEEDIRATLKNRAIETIQKRAGFVAPCDASIGEEVTIENYGGSLLDDSSYQILVRCANQAGWVTIWQQDHHLLMMDKSYYYQQLRLKRQDNT